MLVVEGEGGQNSMKSTKSTKSKNSSKSVSLPGPECSVPRNRGKRRNICAGGGGRGGGGGGSEIDEIDEIDEFQEFFKKRLSAKPGV